MEKGRMKVLITGIAGFLGSHLAEAHAKRGDIVVGVDNLIGGDAANVPHDAHMVFGDCLDMPLMEGLMEGVDVVYHLACTPHEGLSVFSPYLVCQSTFMAAVSVGTAVVRAKVPRLVYASSMARYGAQNGPFLETMPTMPVDPYGISKVAAEDVLKVLAETHGFVLNVAVPHNIYGPRQKYDDPYRNVVGIMMNRCLQGKNPIVYGDGSQTRCFSHVSDVVPCLVTMGVSEGVRGETVNVGPDEGRVSVLELARKIVEISGKPLGVDFSPGRPREVHSATCSSDKARAYLGYRTETALLDGLKDMWAWMQERGPKPFGYHLPLEIVTEKTPETWSRRLF